MGGEGMLCGRHAFGLRTTLGVGVLVLCGRWMLLRAWRRGRDRPLVPAMAEAPFQLDASRIDPIDLTPEMRDLPALAASGDEDAMQEFAALQGPGAGRPALDHEIDIAQEIGRASCRERVCQYV